MSNRGQTSLKCSRRKENAMREYDKLPADLRIWLSTAMLPWRAKSVRRVYDKALARTGDAALALKALDELQRKRVAQDVRKVWGEDHPDAA